MTSRPRRVLLVGGLEPEGRAGLLADAEAVRAVGAPGEGEAERVHPVLVATALTAQGTRTFRTQATSPAMLEAGLTAAREHGRIAAVKVGMVPGRAQWRVLQRFLDAGLDDGRPAWTVLDPVVRTSRGEALSTLRPRDFLEAANERLVLTPNANEAAWLLGAKAAAVVDVEAAIRAGAALCAHGFGAVVVKGGHLRGGPHDVLVTAKGATVFEGVRLRRTSAHRGTGCRFAAALAAALAGGVKIAPAVHAAREVIVKFLRPL